LKINLLFLSIFLILTVSPVRGQNQAVLDDVERLIDSLQTLDAGVFAPKGFEKVTDKFSDVQEDIAENKRSEKIDTELEDARVQALNALDAVQKAYGQFKPIVDLRQRAIDARAPLLAADIYNEAEKKMIEASKKLESNNRNDAIRVSEEAGPLYDQAELTAIKSSLMGHARDLIAGAVEIEAEKYAPITLNKAKTELARADSIIQVDRYERDRSLPLIKSVEYEARLAYHVTWEILDTERTDKTWEQFILNYDEQLNRIARAIGRDNLEFDNGPRPAADTIVAMTEEILKEINKAYYSLGTGDTLDNPVEMASVLRKRVAEIIAEKKKLAETNAAKEKELSQLRATHEEISEDLQKRKEQEARFEKAQSILNPNEGEVLYNASNNIVIHLPGLSFDVGKSDIKEEHIPLLHKIEQILRLFPDARFMVEGHTDDRGNPEDNQVLSEERARAVMEWLKKDMILRPDRISAVGYGSEKPVAPNKTKEGRAKNRRIDIIIIQ